MASIRETGTKVLTNANFTNCSVTNGTLTVDIKPAIWAFTVADTGTQRQEVVVDSLGTMNRFYWDDRVEKGMVKKYDGVSFSKTHLFIKRGTSIRRIPYTAILGNREIKVSKGELYNGFTALTNSGNVLKMVLILLPFVFGFGMAIGMLINTLYMLIVGLLLRLALGKSLRITSVAYKTANGLYVGFAYLVALAFIAQGILFYTLADLSSFFSVVKLTSLLATAGIGYLCLKSLPRNTSVTSSNAQFRRRAS